MNKKDNQYEFEKNARKHSLKSNEMAEKELYKFAARLGFQISGGPSHKNVLLRYVNEHHLNIDWYDKRLKKEKCRRTIFSIISLLLLAVIPIGIFCLSKDTIGLPAQITAILTGMFGVHKSVSSWLDQRKVIANFWNASTDLKDSLYSLKNKWCGKPLINEAKVLSGDFMADITNGIEQARAIVKKEQQNFFSDYALPSVDLAAYLKK